MPFLIDGHNVIAVLSDIDLADPDDEAKLVVKLRAWSGRERRKAQAGQARNVARLVQRARGGRAG